MSVTEYAAAQMRYWCETGDYGGVGYSQPNRWSAYDSSDWDGWLHGPGEADCSSAVSGAYNIAFHHEGVDVDLFPRSTWTGSLPAEAQARGFQDIGDSWTGTVPDGGFRVGDVIMADGHVVMVTTYEPDNPLLSELWIDAAGSIYGSDGGDGSAADDTGGESRSIRYIDHPLTASAGWTTCLRYVGASGSGGSSSSGPAYELSFIQREVLRAADDTGCPWWAALACLWMETGERGANIFGHDAGGAYSGGGEVTETKFRDFLRMIADGWTSNGVGPLQITYPGYFLQDPERRWWEPYESAVVGCRILKGLIDAEGDSYEDLRRVGSRYNSGSSDGAYGAYGVPFSDRCKSWYDYGRPSGGQDGEDWLMSSEAIDLLRNISDAVTPGKAGVKFDGELYNHLKETHNTVERIEAVFQPGKVGVRPAGAFVDWMNWVSSKQDETNKRLDALIAEVKALRAAEGK